MMNDSSFAEGYAIGRDSNGSNNGYNNGGWGEGSWFWGLILLAFLFNGNGWGNGWGGNNGNGSGGMAYVPYAVGNSYTDSALQRGFDTQTIIGKLDGLNSGLCSLGYDQLAQMNGLSTQIATGFANVGNAICNAEYQNAQLNNATNIAIMQGFNGVDRSVCTLGYNMQSGFNATQSAIQNCCCDVRAGLKDIQFQNATDTCAIQTAIASATRDITDNANANYRGIMDFMVQSKIDSLQNENQALRLSASQAAQNSVLMAAMDANKAEILRKTGAECPMPAYVVQPPQPVTFPTNCCGQVNYAGYGNNGCGCNSGCGC